MNINNNRIKSLSLYKRLQGDSGAVAIVVGISLITLMSFAALSIDLGHLFVVKNELQNAADAGALAGARVLYSDDGTTINVGANQTAYDTAVLNKSENVSVDVHGLQDGDVQRGHWSFATRTFTPNPSTAVVDLWGASDEELDADVDFINAVRVKTRREDTPAASFLATIFGKNSFTLSADAVAYIGFAGQLEPGEGVTMPIAICDGELKNLDPCSQGMFIDSGLGNADRQTGGWTSYEQADVEAGEPEDLPCAGGTNASEVRKVVDVDCLGGSDRGLELQPVATMGGEAETVLSKVRKCWGEATDNDLDGEPDTSWSLKLPMIMCEGNNVGTCSDYAGVLSVDVVWITGPGTSTCDFRKAYTNAEGVFVEGNLPPLKVDDWECLKGGSPLDVNSATTTDADLLACWDQFVADPPTGFGLKTPYGAPADCRKKTLYFKPDCEKFEPTGRSGGRNYGILAKIPVLVE